MPIAPFLEGKAVGPDALPALNDVFVDVCARLGLVDKADPVTRLVAEKLIELAARHCDREDLRRAAYVLFGLDA